MNPSQFLSGFHLGQSRAKCEVRFLHGGLDSSFLELFLLLGLIQDGDKIASNPSKISIIRKVKTAILAQGKKEEAPSIFRTAVPFRISFLLGHPRMSTAKQAALTLVTPILPWTAVKD